MNISHYIAALEKIRARHGELQIDSRGFHGERISARLPEVAYRKILGSRERKMDFFSTSDKPNRRGEKVVRI